MLNTVKKFNKSIMFIVKSTLFFSFLGIFLYVWDTAYSEVSYFRQGNYVVALSYSIILLAFISVYSGFKMGILRITELVYSNALAITLANIIIYLQFCLITYKILPPAGIIFMTIFQLSAAAIVCYIGNRIYFSLNPAREVIAVCDETIDSQMIINKMNKIKDRYAIKEVVYTSQDLDCVKKRINCYSSVLIGDMDSNIKKEVISYCYGNNKRIYISPTTADIIINRTEQTYIFDTPVFICDHAGLSTEQLITKRVLDIVISVIIIIITSPLMLLTALSINLYDKGPIFFKQIRLTRDKKPFKLYKFRSMIIEAEKDGVARLATKNDSRITPIGKFIRKVRLDELPQLFNVLIGDMSIVGPRPERPEIEAQYVSEMPEFRYRLKVKAGLTGYAQVKGKYNTTPKDKLNLDLLYIQSYSLMLDIKLIFMTLKIMFMPESTEGIEEGNITSKVLSNNDQSYYNYNK